MGKAPKTSISYIQSFKNILAKYRPAMLHGLQLLKITLVGYWPVLLISALFIAIQWPVLHKWWKVWNEDYSYYSHGPLVPFIVAYMIWGNRNNIANSPVRPCLLGYPLLIISGILFVLGNWTLTTTIQAIVFIAMIFSALLLIAGTKITKILIVPVFFLLSMIPITPNLLDSATGKLQLYSAIIAAKMLILTGYDATLQGATIFADGLPQPLVVGIPCSGLRILISLLTFTVFFVYLVRAQWWKKALLILISFPLSMFINSLRIAMIGYSGFFTGSAEVMHQFHDYSGYIGLIICFTLLFGIAKLMKINEFGIVTKPLPTNAVNHDLRKPVGAGIAGLTIVLVFALAGSSNFYVSPVYPQTKGQLVRSNIPMSFNQWTGQDIPIDDMIKDTLKQGDLLSRVYTDNSEYARQVQVFITASKDPAGFHDPHTCLPNGGSPINNERILTMQFKKPKPMTIRASLLESTSDYGRHLVLYWYMAGSDSMPRTSDVWTRNRTNLVKDIAALVMHPTSKDKLKTEIEQRQFIWYRFSTEAINDDETDIKFLIKFAEDFSNNVKGFGK